MKCAREKCKFNIETAYGYRACDAERSLSGALMISIDKNGKCTGFVKRLNQLRGKK